MANSLRPAAKSDFAFCESLNRSNMASYFLARGIPWDSHRFATDWARFENFVIVANGSDVGTLRLLEVCRALEVRDLHVLPSHQGKGIGTWALTHAKTVAADRGLELLNLRLFPDNPAQQLYARLGFSVAAIAGGVVHMSYRLPPNNSFKPNPLRGSA